MLCFVYLSDMLCVFFFKQKTAYEMRISDWSSDVCSSDLSDGAFGRLRQPALHLIEIFEHARARPVEIGAILEDDIDEAVTKEAVASNRPRAWHRSEEHTSELQSLMRISYAVFCLKKKNKKTRRNTKVTQYTAQQRRLSTISEY